MLSTGSSHQSTDPGVIPVHPDFRMIALANRPGFPFLGNDFYAALGTYVSIYTLCTLCTALYVACLLHRWTRVTSMGRCCANVYSIGYFLRYKMFLHHTGDMFSCHAVDNPDLESELVSKRNNQ